jgi:hypothetical protein
VRPIGDLSGQRFGHWIVLYEHDRRWLRRAWMCACACGTERVVMQAQLRAGKSKSCGCHGATKDSHPEPKPPRRIDLTGLRFHRLVVIGDAPNDAYGRRRFDCQCDCGATCVVYYANLTSQRTKSCGCLARDVLSGVVPPTKYPDEDIEKLRRLGVIT